MVAALAAATAVFAMPAGSASAHSLASSSVTIELADDHMTGEVSLAVASLDEAFEPALRSDVLSDDAYAAQVLVYLDDHLTVTGVDGTVWQETYSVLRRETVEGIETIDVELAFDVAAVDPAQFTITYDAIVEADDAHEAVLVLVDATNRVSTPGVFTSDGPSIAIGQGTSDDGLGASLARLWPVLPVAVLLFAGGLRWRERARAADRTNRRGPALGISRASLATTPGGLASLRLSVRSRAHRPRLTADHWSRP